MSEDILLVGPLAHPALCGVLGVTGLRTTVPGRLLGGARAGIEADGWPQLAKAPAPLDALQVTMTPRLERYAAVMRLPMTAHEGATLLGVRPYSGEDAAEWLGSAWLPDLAAVIAGIILDESEDQPPERIARRLPMIGVWAESRLRAASSGFSGGNVVAPRSNADIRLHARHQPYAGFFTFEEWRLSHRTHAGGFTPELRREGFVMGDAVVVLPWDPVRDRVLVIEQFRLGPAMRHDPQPWMLEAIAGRIDAGETVEEAARREALEEADLQLIRLIPAIHHYPSPGAVTEFLYQFLGIADLPDGCAGIHGLDGEAEDIRGHLLKRSELTAMVLAGQITNGPLAMMALWLEGQAESLRAAGPGFS
ncbi:NUDIX domain-containing protein [Paracoccus alkanivorans]|uniref:NUDIX domain-containing protein n=1 Tax=Paracoccus alkanivorans TaxID=2116655 RepID=A0A3M0N286_9RHOB|nr:NUDIX domain-containing protein [Paracoccus alkanivorans]RMC37837.1 NUDIX domain-containing protein [Paracoccus alkanivorans]